MTERSPDHEPDTSQTYDWDGAEAVLARCSHSLLLAEMFGRVHPPGDRIEASRTTAQAADRLASPAPVWCPSSTRVVELASFHRERPGADVQRHFRSLDPGRVAGHLSALAAYVIEQGDVIEPGHTVAGIERSSARPPYAAR